MFVFIYFFSSLVVVTLNFTITKYFLFSFLVGFTAEPSGRAPPNPKGASTQEVICSLKTLDIEGSGCLHNPLTNELPGHMSVGFCSLIGRHFSDDQQ